ncbi:hypothetical protein KTD19_16915 [Burkholderia multivorans]|uniref:hypothetical protein n=1 Tax=Burkholderia multivorans TaxID=87883 RepID=UPI001C21CA5B|nr:hypothetical protein [Burkholderia multivorans]MBU9234064.1 hypothetical protein [Burkholderia multivorans]MDR8750750.1 hypothetical protein [Burkholderia multivorans]MDR8809692.1 hypothetical protein [Burkholderia multivorans]
MTDKKPNDLGHALLDQEAELTVLKVAFSLFIRMQPPDVRTTLGERLTAQISQWQELGMATEHSDEYLELLGQHAARLRSLIEE